MKAGERLRVPVADIGSARSEARIMPPLPESIIEQLAELWCEALLANLRRHPLPTALQRGS